MISHADLLNKDLNLIRDLYKRKGASAVLQWLSMAIGEQQEWCAMNGRPTVARYLHREKKIIKAARNHLYEGK